MWRNKMTVKYLIRLNKLTKILIIIKGENFGGKKFVYCKIQRRTAEKFGSRRILWMKNLQDKGSQDWLKYTFQTRRQQ